MYCIMICHWIYNFYYFDFLSVCTIKDRYLFFPLLFSSSLVLLFFVDSRSKDFVDKNDDQFPNTIEGK